MLFNTPIFVVFFALVFAGYWALRDRRRQNLLLLAASYVFYGAWSWMFLGLLMGTTLLDYASGRWLEAARTPRVRRSVLIGSVAINLAVLGTFKYLGFFASQAAALLEAMGLSANMPVLRVVLPVGISFYTFQSIGYVVDVYRRKVPASRSLAEYALYVAFFPQLVAGPIERAAHMLPQFRRERAWNAAALESGLMLILWGLLKKVVVADNLAPYVNAVFAAPGEQPASAVATAILFFAFQIYGDFSGYSDTARGVARTLGFELLRNFDHPYVARNPVDFWRRWHMSLSQWFQDYLYFPLAMRFMRAGRGWAGRYGAHVVSMALIGLWHGASWTFVAFGLYWGGVIAAYLMLGDARNAARAPRSRTHEALVRAASIGSTFALACIGWVLFRAASLGDVGRIVRQLLGGSVAELALRRELPATHVGWMLIAALLAAEWLARRVAGEGGMRARVPTSWWTAPWPAMLMRYAMLGAIVFSWIVVQEGQPLPFIYFQF